MKRAVKTIVASTILTGVAAGQIAPGEGYVQVTGGKVWYRIVGGGSATPLLLLHGGPGFTSHYLDRLQQLSDERPVIFYDQLGAGRSERPEDAALWRVERFVEELAQLRIELDLTRVHILGHSWGTQLAVDYVLTKPEGVESLVLSSPALSIPRWAQDAHKLRKTLPGETQKLLVQHEKAGTTDSEEYQTAMMEYYKRYMCQLDPWPQELEESFAEFSPQVYGTMWGASEFFPNGNLRAYDRTSRLGEIDAPILFTAGRHDEATPETTKWYQGMAPNSSLVVFENSAHLAMVEETDRYIQVVRDFLRKVESDRE